MAKKCRVFQLDFQLDRKINVFELKLKRANYFGKHKA